MQSGIRNRMKLVRKAIQKLKAGWAGGDGMQNDRENQYYARPGTTERQPLSQVHCAPPRIRFDFISTIYDHACDARSIFKHVT